MGSRSQKKRSLIEDDESELKDAKAFKRRKSEKAASSKGQDSNFDLGLNINTTIGRLNSPLLADYVAQQTKRHMADCSLIELEDQRIPEKAFLDTSDWPKPRTTQGLPAFLEAYSASRNGKTLLASASAETGCPHTLIITSAGQRAADLIRPLRVFQTKEAAIAKLFAKHIKLEEAIHYVKEKRVGIGVGTPSRINALLEDGGLSTKGLDRIVIDGSHLDQKRRGILDMREVQQPLMLLLNRPDIKARLGVGDGEINVLLY